MKGTRTPFKTFKGKHGHSKTSNGTSLQRCSEASEAWD
jgi:hypothetical protein